MGNFRRDDSRSSGGGFGRKSYGGRDGGSGGSRFGGRDGGRDGGRPTMHSATCSECGDNCEVPFKPTGDKPIFCSDCFGRQKSRDGGRDSGSSRPSYGGDRRERRERPSFGGGDRQMYDAVCAKCNESCQVPFRPTDSKPVYCSNCFEKGGKVGGAKGTGQSNEQLTEINKKLDLIMNSLGLTLVKKETARKPEAKKEVNKKVKPLVKEEIKKETVKTVKVKKEKVVKEKKAKAKKSATQKVTKKAVAKKKK
ncbi:hypothetical protein KJ785_01240 [Patescibacteria group bacterium]|nr:hypothetical protein [Patescibacteria group bacterium]